jgi:flagellar protein FlbD
MIELTRLNGQPFFVNCDLLKFAESAPDTVLTLITGEKIVVSESCAEIVIRSRAWRASILQAAWPAAIAAPAPLLFDLAPSRDAAARGHAEAKER